MSAFTTNGQLQLPVGRKIDFTLLPQPIVANNGAAITSLADKADRAMTRIANTIRDKYQACASHECVSCPNARGNGSC